MPSKSTSAVNGPRYRFFTQIQRAQERRFVDVVCVEHVSWLPNPARVGVIEGVAARRVEAMAERTTAKAKRTDAGKPAKSQVSSPAGAENARLKAELAEALERIADLEIKHAEIVNRIDRVIDSLHKLSG